MAMMNVIVPEFGGPDRRSVSERITGTFEFFSIIDLADPVRSYTVVPNMSFNLLFL